MRSSRVLASDDDLPRLVLARTLREHPEWLFADVAGIIERGGPRADALGRLTIAELVHAGVGESCPDIDRARRWRAMQRTGAAFDQLVFEVLCEAPGPVAASYIRARLGGPRWKLQASYRRLMAAKRIKRTGNTSSVRYHAVGVQA
jgi:hypothetical protein